MKFDVIIGNPPYQLNVGNEGGNSGKALAIYHLFIEKAIELNPKYISMIIPSRWMTNSAEGISQEWTNSFIKSNKIVELHDYENGDSLFNGVGINGGLNYFLWRKDYSGKCNYHYYPENNEKQFLNVELGVFNLGFVIRDPRNHSIIKKIEKIQKDYYKEDSESNFSTLVSQKDFFTNREKLTSNWRGYEKNKTEVNNIKYYISESTNGVPYGWIKLEDIGRNLEYRNKRKVIIPASHGGQSQVLGVPRYSEIGSVCSQTYIMVGHDKDFSKEEIINIMRYISTKFFRFMVKMKKVTQNGPRSVYQLVPVQDWTISVSDKTLYSKYNLSKEEIDLIESTISEVDISREIAIAESIVD